MVPNQCSLLREAQSASWTLIHLRAETSLAERNARVYVKSGTAQLPLRKFIFGNGERQPDNLSSSSFKTPDMRINAASSHLASFPSTAGCCSCYPKVG